MPIELLTQAGLTPTQAEILGYLLTQKELKAKELVIALARPRGVIYKGLEELVGLELVIKVEAVGAVARFKAAHPAQLERLFEAKEKAAKRERESFIQNLPELAAAYNLSQHQPVVRTLEGETGLRLIGEEVIRAGQEVLVFLDKDTLGDETFLEASRQLDQRCRSAQLKQRVIVASEPPTQGSGSEADELMEIRYLGSGQQPFRSAVRLFGTKTAYQQFENGQTITVLVEDQNINGMNRAMFEFLWQQAK